MNFKPLHFKALKHYTKLLFCQSVFLQRANLSLTSAKICSLLESLLFSIILFVLLLLKFSYLHYFIYCLYSRICINFSEIYAILSLNISNHINSCRMSSAFKLSSKNSSRIILASSEPTTPCTESNDVCVVVLFCKSCRIWLAAYCCPNTRDLVCCN